MAKPRPHPLILRWHEPNDPLPTREIRGIGPRDSTSWSDAHASAASGQSIDEAFDFCAGIQRLVSDIALRCDAFRHLDVARILVTVIQARSAEPHGLQARVTPLRFPNGALTRQRRGVPFHIQRYFLGEHEFLYLLTFCLPRYLDLDFDAKLVTLFHELNHISPAFNGDLRRHEGRYHYHSHSQRDYDEGMVHHARDYLAGNPDPSLHGFLRLNFTQLQKRHGSVTGIVVPRPKIIPLVGPYAPAAAKEGDKVTG